MTERTVRREPDPVPQDIDDYIFSEPDRGVSDR